MTQLVDRYGWAEMGDRIPIRCFQLNLSVNSSLTLLRKTPWARQKVKPGSSPTPDILAQEIAAELWTGVKKGIKIDPHPAARLEAFLGLLQLAGFTLDAALHYAEIRSTS